MKVHVSQSIDKHDLSAMRNNRYLNVRVYMHVRARIGVCVCVCVLPRNNNLAQEQKIREALI